MPINYPYHSQSTKWMPWASGRPWNGIADVIKINTVWLVDTYRILFTNGTYTDFDITNWLIWSNGTNWTNWTNGTNWVDWNWIVSVTPFSTVGLVKTYRILFDDATTFDYTVSDGAAWAGSWDMLKSDNLSGLANYTTARTNLGLGSLATQSGTFSGTSSGSNTGDNATNTTYTTLATTLSIANTWSAVQTFLAGMMGLRNVANTFTSFFTNVATASRTWTLPDANTIVPIISQILTFSWPTAARTITLPDANFTVARTDAANTFTGVQTMTSPVFTTPVLWTPTSWVATNLTGTATGLTSGITNALKSATTTVDVSAATAPSSWQVLTATSSTTATWQTPAAGGSFKGCRVKQSTTQSVWTTLVAIAFDAETFDTDTMHDNVTNNTRITFTTAWYYQISGVFNSDANVVSRAGLRLNWTTYIYEASVGNAGASLANGDTIASIYQFSAADYIELMWYFSSTQNTKTGENGTHLSVARLW